MFSLKVPLGLLLLLEPPVDPGSAPGSREAVSQDGPATSAVEDMPDPYSPDWEPPDGPKKPPPAPPAPSLGSGDHPPAYSSLAPDPSSEAAQLHGQRLQVAGLVFGASGVIGLAVGAYVFVEEYEETKAARDSEQLFADRGAATPGLLGELEAKLETQQQVMLISFASGGAALAVGVILFGTGIAVKKRSARPAITGLSPGPGLGGLTIGGRF